MPKHHVPRRLIEMHVGVEIDEARQQRAVELDEGAVAAEVGDGSDGGDLVAADCDRMVLVDIFAVEELVGADAVVDGVDGEGAGDGGGGGGRPEYSLDAPPGITTRVKL
ncbi:MAG: hypothetical protein HOV83_27730 [Catenulispora sp.]|nr:hypothetical protein [Catenulispora sp.]